MVEQKLCGKPLYGDSVGVYYANYTNCRHKLPY